MTEKLTRPKTERQKRREIEYHLYHARKYEEQDNRTSYDLCDIHDVKCESKIFNQKIKLDVENFGYFKTYDMALERDSIDNQHNHVQWLGHIAGAVGFIRDDPPEWCPESIPSFEIMQMKNERNNRLPKREILFCRRCGNEFEGEWRGRVFCSEKCRIYRANQD